MPSCGAAQTGGAGTAAGHSPSSVAWTRACRASAGRAVRAAGRASEGGSLGA